MKTWAIVFGLAGMAGSVVFMVYILRNWRPSKRHVIAGAFSSFLLACVVVFSAVAPPHWVTYLTQGTLLAFALAFFAMEIRLERLDRKL